MGGAFGAIGDHVLWGTWRPFCAVLAMCVGLWVAYPGRGKRPLEPIIVSNAGGHPLRHRVVGRRFFRTFNVVHLWLRWRGLAALTSPSVRKWSGWVQSLHLQPWAAQIRRLGLLVMVVITDFDVSGALAIVRYVVLAVCGFAGYHGTQAVGGVGLGYFLYGMCRFFCHDKVGRDVALIKQYITPLSRRKACERVGVREKSAVPSPLYRGRGNQRKNRTLNMKEQEFKSEEPARAACAAHAAIFVQTTSKFKSNVKVRRGDQGSGWQIDHGPDDAGRRRRRGADDRRARAG